MTRLDGVLFYGWCH